MNKQSALKLCILASLVSGIAYIVLEILRLLSIINLMHTFLAINMLTLAGIAAIGLWNWRQLSLRSVEWLLFACIFVSSLATDYTDRSMANIVIDIVRPVLFVLVVATLRSLMDLRAFDASIAVRRLLSMTVWVTLLVVPFCYAISALVKPLYPAYSSIDSILGLGWLGATSSFGASLLYMLVLFVSGKRAVYLVAFFLLVFLYRAHKKHLAWIAVSVATAIALSPLLMPADVSFLMKSPTVSWYSTPEAKAYMVAHPREITAISASRNGNLILKIINVATGGRLDEIRDATSEVPHASDYILGVGPGFAYHTKVMDEEGMKHRNLHFTPLSLIVYYGVLFFGLFAAYLGSALMPVYRLLKDRSQPVLFAYGAYFLASLPFCLTEYSIFAYSNFAIACGLVMAYGEKQRCTRPYDTL